jgi:hypothetical protein
VVTTAATFVISTSDCCTAEGQTMAKGKNSNKEAKKPKLEKPKVSATAISIAGKKVK